VREFVIVVELSDYADDLSLLLQRVCPEVSWPIQLACCQVALPRLLQAFVSKKLMYGERNGFGPYGRNICDNDSRDALVDPEQYRSMRVRAAAHNGKIKVENVAMGTCE